MMLKFFQKTKVDENHHYFKNSATLRPDIIQGGGSLPGDNFDGDNFDRGKISPPPGILRLVVIY